MRRGFRTFRLVVTSALFLALSACGGGGGGGGSASPPPAPPPPPPPPAGKTLSGVVMLGPVSGADVEISGTGGVLGAGTTGADGSFGPIEYSLSYDGPLRVTVTGNPTSQWVCDFRLGCDVSGATAPYGASIPFDGELEAVLPAAVDEDFVSVSMLSSFVAERMDVLGGLSTANIDLADNDIRQMIDSAIGDVLDDYTAGLPFDFSRVELFDLENLPARGGPNDSLSILLSLFNSAIMGMSDESDTTGQFIDSLSNKVATQPMIPLASPTESFFEPSQESFLLSLLVQASETNSDTAAAVQVDALLAPLSLLDVVTSAFNSYEAMPQFIVGDESTFQVNISFGDVDLGRPKNVALPIRTNTGAPIEPIDFRIATDFVEPTTVQWADVTPGSFGLNDTRIVIQLDPDVVATLPNGTHVVVIEAYSIFGTFRRDFVEANLEVDLTGQ